MHGLKEPSPVFSTFFQTFGDFGITRKLMFFSQPMENFTAEKRSIWKILMKMYLVMVTIFQASTGRYRQLQCTKLLGNPIGLTVSTKILKGHWTSITSIFLYLIL